VLLILPVALLASLASSLSSDDDDDEEEEEEDDDEEDEDDELSEDSEDSEDFIVGLFTGLETGDVTGDFTGVFTGEKSSRHNLQSMSDLVSRKARGIRCVCPSLQLSIVTAQCEKVSPSMHPPTCTLPQVQS